MSSAKNSNAHPLPRQTGLAAGLWLAAAALVAVSADRSASLHRLALAAAISASCSASVARLQRDLAEVWWNGYGAGKEVSDQMGRSDGA